MNSENIDRETSELLHSFCPGCVKKSKNFEEHYICMSMSAFSYCDNNVRSNYYGTSTNNSSETKTANGAKQSHSDR